MDLDKIENDIKNNEEPLELLFSIYSDNNINDYNKSIATKFLFKYHIKISLNNNLLAFDNIEDFPLTYNLISNTYNILAKQLNLLPELKKFYSSYNNYNFNKKDIEEQIIHLKNLQKKLLIIFDGSKTNAYFHIKLKNLINPNNHYHTEQIMERLKNTLSLFKLSFFQKHKIMLLSNYQFLELTFENMVKYVEYVFNKLNNYLSSYISSFELYNYYRKELLNILLISQEIYIDDNDDGVNSDIDEDDLKLLIIKH
jgi:hypothetical protein